MAASGGIGGFHQLLRFPLSIDDAARLVFSRASKIDSRLGFANSGTAS
jgi:hypothetical protein